MKYSLEQRKKAVTSACVKLRVGTKFNELEEKISKTPLWQVFYGHGGYVSCLISTIEDANGPREALYRLYKSIK